MSKLRLKKRSDNSTLHATTSNTVEISAGNGDFKPVRLPTARSRKLLHKLLLGDGPLTFTPFPPSQLFLSPETAEKSTKEGSFSSEEDDEAKRWTPLPPPNMAAILRQMPGPPMTVEELYAPSSDEEGEESEKTARGKREKEAEKSSQILSNSTHPVSGENLTDHSSISHRQDHTQSLPALTETATREHAQGNSAPSTVSGFISNLRTNHQNTRAVVRKVSGGQVPKKVLSGDVIDLTEHSLPHQPSTSGSNHQSTSQNLTSSTDPLSMNPLNSAHEADPYELQDYDDFDVLCLDVDLSTIDDFSDTESTAVAEPRIEQVSYSGKGKSRAGSTDQPMKKYAGVKRPNDFENGSRSKQRRLESSGPQTGITSVGVTCASGHTELSSTAASSAVKTQTEVQRDTARTSDRISQSQGGVARDKVSVGITTSCSGTSQETRESVNCTTAFDSEPQLTSASSSRPRSQGTPAVESRTSSDTGGHTGTTSVGGGSRVTPLGSRLTTDNCPMCNTRFPTWYEQVDADCHIAKCLQAVLDLEMENELVLL